MTVKLRFENYEELKPLVGSILTTSDPFLITQELLTKFSDATLDDQWIHLDPEKCKTDSPYGKPVAHGFLLVALIPYLYETTIILPPARIKMNCSINEVKFLNPILVDDKVYATFKLDKIAHRRDFWQITWINELYNQSNILCTTMNWTIRRYI